MPSETLQKLMLCNGSTSVWYVSTVLTRNKKGQGKKLTPGAHVCTNDLGLEDAQQDHNKRTEKKQKEAAKHAWKAAKQKEDLVRRATQGSTRAFVGSLSLTENKTELEDIADAVGINISGTKAQLLEQITNHFNDHPQFKEDPHFIGMFDRVPGRKRTAPGPVCRHRLSPSGHLDTVTNTYNSSHPIPHHFSVLSFQLVASSSQVTVENLPDLPMYWVFMEYCLSIYYWYNVSIFAYIHSLFYNHLKTTTRELCMHSSSCGSMLGAWILLVTCPWQLFASLVPLPQNLVIAWQCQFFINKSEKFKVGLKCCVECKYKILVGNVLIYKL